MNVRVRVRVRVRGTVTVMVRSKSFMRSAQPYVGVEIPDGLLTRS